MRTTDPLEAAEDFIEKVIVPRRSQPSPEPEVARAWAELDREDLEFVRLELIDAGLDLERLDKLAAERSKRRTELAEEMRRNAIARSGDAWRRIRDLAPEVDPIDPLDIIIEQVTFIRTFAGQGEITESNTGPLENWAKYRLRTTGNPWEGTGRLSFFTLWQNPRDNPTIIMPRPNLQFVAHLACGAEANGPGSWFGFSSEGRARIRARTTVWGMDSSVSTVVHDQILYETVAIGHFFGGSSDLDMSFNQIFPATGAAVPSQAYALIEVELLTEWVARHGSVHFDAASDNYRVYLPRIIITQAAPPILLSSVVDYGTSPATVTLIFSGATGTMVDIYQDGARLGDTENDGAWSRQYPPGTYRFRVCETQGSVCSAEVSVTVTQ